MNIGCLKVEDLFYWLEKVNVKRKGSVSGDLKSVSAKIKNGSAILKFGSDNG